MLLTKQLTIVTVLLFTFLILLPVEAGIAAYTFNKKQEDFLHLPALFSRYIPGGDGRNSRLVVAEPENACGDIAKASDTGISVLIRSFDCDFDVKVSNAMAAGYEAAIVHNVGSNELILMGSYWDVMKWIRINIPAVFVGEGTATALKENYTHEGNHIVIKSAYLGQTILTEVIHVFVTLIFIGLIGGLVGLMVHTLLSLKVFLQKRCRARRIKEQLNKLLVHKYQEGDTYDVCAVCLEDYQAGDMLWVLPCSHAYHKKCVDQWLSKMMKNTCPTCTQKVYSEQV